MGCTASRPSTSLPPESNVLENLFYPSPLKDYLSCPSSSVTSTPSNVGTCTRSLFLNPPLVHHPPYKKGDTHHIVSLKSTTYGYLQLADSSPPKMKLCVTDDDWPTGPNVSDEAPSPDSVINTWELMDGLEEDVDQRSQKIEPLKESSPLCEIQTELPSKSPLVDQLGPDSFVKALDGDGGFRKSKPLWKYLSEESLLSSMDPNVASSYIRALSFRQLGLRKDYREVRSLGSSPLAGKLLSRNANAKSCPPAAEDKIVFYFTSLRGIRQTYEDCCFVRMLLRGFQVPVDERDISMDLAFRNELRGVFKGEPVKLPQVFVRGKLIGGAEELKKLNEDGGLAKLLEGFSIKNHNLVCESCGDARFIPCPNCSGSRKIFNELDEQWKKCLDCNENGLLRCRACCA